MHQNKSRNYLLVGLISILLLIVIVPTFFILGKTNNVSAESTKDRRIGCWWWHYADSTNATTRTKYLNFLDEHGVTEIYFYAYEQLKSSSGRKEIHTFVQEANALNMRVSILYEYADGVMSGASSTLTTLKNAYNSYKSEYPDDNLYGFHFDIEPGQSTSIFTRYCNNFIKYLSILRDNGCEVEVDVGCGWGSYGQEIELNGVRGLYDIIAANVDTMTLMSYRDTAKAIVAMGYDPLQACKAQGCDVLFGVETDNANEGDQVDFSGESVQYLMEEIDKVFDLLSQKDLNICYGMAIHHARAFNNLRLLSPTTEAMRKTKIYSKKDMNLDMGSGKNAYIYTDPELVQALHDDYQEFGIINDTESYYLITIACKTGVKTYMYPCLWDSTNEFDLWPNGISDYPKGTESSTSLKNIQSIVRNMNYKKAQKDAVFEGEEDGIYIYLESLTSLTIDSVTVEVYHPERLYPDISDDSDASTTSTDKPSHQVIFGDANMDEVVDLKDVLVVRKYIAHITVEAIDLELSDANTDDNVDMKDILEIRKFIAHQPSTLDDLNRYVRF